MCFQVVSLKRVKHELELKLREQEEELDDQAGQIQQLEQVQRHAFCLSDPCDGEGERDQIYGLCLSDTHDGKGERGKVYGLCLSDTHDDKVERDKDYGLHLSNTQS